MDRTIAASAPILTPTTGSADSAAASAVSWGAIFAGAAGAAALSLILLVLGVGLGMSAVSPFSGQGVAGSTFGWSTILWVTLTQLAASAMGGYLAGRLRTRWAATNGDEVYFRDTAHGFVAWAVATLVTAATLTSAIGSIAGTAAQAAGSVAGGVATAAASTAGAAGAAAAGKSETAPNHAYFIDSLFRAASPVAPGSVASAAASGSDARDNGSMRAPTEEVGRIFANALASGSLPQDDAAYVAQVVAQRTGMPAADAQKRVTDTFARLQAKARETEAAAKDAADKARKASAYAALWMFVSLLGGAFVASLSATFGGRRRDLI